MGHCAVPGCGNCSRNKQCCFSFPENNETKAKWFDFLRKCNKHVNESKIYSICEFHFRPCDIIDGAKRKTLRPGSIPTIISHEAPNSVKATEEEIEIEKNLRDNAVPKLFLTVNPVKITNVVCGSCLNVGEQQSQSNTRQAEAFREITQFKPLTNFVCKTCSNFLTEYSKFQEMVKNKHRLMRNATKKTNIECDYCPFTSANQDELENHVVIVHQVSAADKMQCHWVKVEPESFEMEEEPFPESNQVEEAVTVDNAPDLEVVEVKTEVTETSQKPDLSPPHSDLTKKTVDTTELVKRIQTKKTRKTPAPEIEKPTRPSELPHRRHRRKEPVIAREEFDVENLPTLPINANQKKSKESDIHNLIVCPICWEEMEEPRLERHTRLNHLPKQFLCHFCPRKFSFQQTLEHHVNRHEGTMPHVCDLCGFSANLRNVISSHIKRVHLKIPKRHCNICQQKYFQIFKFKRHTKICHPNGEDNGLRVNSETNFFDCEKCGASFRDMHTILKHTCEKGRLQQRCLECNLPCSSYEMVKKHMKKAHPKLTKPR